MFPTVCDMEHNGAIQANTDRLWDSEDTAKFFGVSVATILRRRKAGLLPAVQPPGTSGYRFRPESMQAIARMFEAVNSTDADVLRSAR